MATLDEILADAEQSASRRVVNARVLIRQDLLARHGELDAALQDALRHDRRPDLSLDEALRAPAIAEQIQALEAEIEAAKVEFSFRSIGRRAWRILLGQHPPTEAQLARDRNADHNPETFPVVALAASWVDPESADWVVDLDGAEFDRRVDLFGRMEQALNHTQFDLLWVKCVDANVGGVATPKSLAAGTILQANGRSGSTAANVASPEASSSDES